LDAGLAAVGQGADSPAAGKQVATSSTVKVKENDAERTATLRYLLYLPADYDKGASEKGASEKGASEKGASEKGASEKRASDGDKWPLVLFLHGSGERGDDIEKVKIHGPPKLVSEGKEFPFILVSPQCPTGSGWNAQELAAVVDELSAKHRVDRQRLYVTGLSMGGGGTWSLITAYPDKFAAAMPLCGRGDLSAVEKIAKVPTWVLVGDKDRAATVENCKEMAAALKKAGGDAKLTVYPDVGHDCWTATYNNPEVYEWLLAKRQAN
jgi:predicted peptidase